MSFAFFWVVPRRLWLNIDVSEHSVCSIFIGEYVWSTLLAYEDGTERSETSALNHSAEEQPRRKQTARFKQSVDDWRFTAATRFRVRASPCGLCGGPGDTGTYFSASNLFFPCEIHWWRMRLARSQNPEGPAIGHLDTGFSLGFPVSKNKCWDGSQFSKLPLHASHVALSK
jgi:hypothetical protein